MEVLLPSDELILQEKGISKEQIEEQLHFFETGFPFLKIVAPAVIGKGITVVDNEKGNFYINKWESYRQKEGVNIVKFVPASGAASRMFKDLYEFLESDSEAPQKSSVKEFFSQIEKFAFYEELNKACLKNEGATIAELIKNNKLKAVVENLLLEKGLNYGFLPKGLLLFHSYTDEKRTPVQEHLVEGALYAANAANDVNIHFTVSHQHKALFEKHIRETLEKYQQKFNVRYHVSFSEQKSSTDTLAVDMNNRPFRENGKLVFRPGGHGALLENLNDLFADIILIKNIDNVVPDSFKEITVKYKKIIAGVLIDVQQKCFDYLKELETNYLTEDRLKEMLRFTESTLCIYNPEANSFGADTLKKYLIRKLNRPIRVCGMVKNTGEPGGGPFLTINNDGTVSPQILVSSQINLNNQEDKQKMENSTHFNPVDLVCSVKNYKGEKFDLMQYVDKKTGFISIKSKNGKELKALELPGLWNGSMSDWNTVFVEVPIETFNPVKTVNDLLRPQHQ
jgi:hypothetical protein